LDWQQALIEEARRQARRRRQRYAALTLLGVTLAVVVGLTRVSGLGPGDVSSALTPSGQGSAIATNGNIAFADDLGRLQLVAPDASEARVIADCRPPTTKIDE